MSRSVRPSTPADAAAIVALLAEAGLRANVEPQDLHWKYWLPRADWPKPRSFVLTDGRDPIAHAAIVPGAWSSGTQRGTVIHMIDWAARRTEVGAGAVLVKYIGQQADALLAIGGTEDTLEILPHLGFRAVGALAQYVRTLQPLRLLGGAGRRTRRALPRFARGLIRALAAPRIPTGEWQARRIAAGDLGEISAVLPRPVRGIAVLERNVGLFAHVLECPIAPMQLYLLERARRVRGYFLLASAPGQVRIADCWMDSDEPADWRALIGCAVGHARLDPHAAEIVGWGGEPLQARALEACGFHSRHGTPVQIRPRGGSAMPEALLRVQMLDSDAAYLNDGRKEFWT
jgi:hypothetical protein